MCLIVAHCGYLNRYVLPGFWRAAVQVAFDILFSSHLDLSDAACCCGAGVASFFMYLPAERQRFSLGGFYGGGDE